MKVAPKLYRVESNGKLHLSFNDAQLAAWDSQARFTFMVMGTRGGKTSFSPWWLWREINTTADPEGNNDYLAVTSTYKLFDNAFRPMMQEVFEHVLQTARYWPAAQVFELKDPRKGFWAKRASDRMWGRILMRTAEAWQSLEAMRARAAVLDECVAPETMIATEVGDLPISEIVKQCLAVRVWSYSAESRRLELRPIKRWIRLPQKKRFIKSNVMMIEEESRK